MPMSTDVRHQTLAIIPICLTELSSGFGYAWPAPTIKYLLDSPNPEISVTLEDCSWIASIGEFGRTFGPILSMIFLDIVGRKLILQIGPLLHLLMWISIIFTRSVSILIIVRLAFGIAVGIIDVVTSIYFGENCSPNLRGIFTCIAISCFYLGVLLQYLIVTYIPYHTVAIINAIIAFIALLSSLLLVETPQYLILHEKFNKAEENMMWLNGTKTKETIASQFEDIKANVASEKQKKSSLKEVFSSPANYRSLIIITLSHAFHMASGPAVIFFYATIIFQSTDLLTPFEFTIGFGVAELFASILASIIIEKYSRRSLAMATFAGFVICHSCIALVYIVDIHIAYISYGPWLIFSLVCLFSCFNAIMDGLLYIIRGELFPQSIKSFGSGFAIITQSFFSFITVKMFFSIQQSFGIYCNFLLFAFISFIALWFIHYLLPESRGKTLIEIQKQMEKNKS